MLIIIMAWWYIVILMSIAQDTVREGFMVMVFFGIIPSCIVLFWKLRNANRNEHDG
jgi:hypothetical protein